MKYCLFSLILFAGEKLATDCRSKESRQPISSNQSKPRVNPSPEKENPHEEHRKHLIHSGS